MIRILGRYFILVVSVFLLSTSVNAEPLTGTTGSAAGGTVGNQWQSSWLDINPPITFRKGETLKIKVDGDAENVLVRLLPTASFSSSSDGIEVKVRKVPASKTLEIKLSREHLNVKQISVHAGNKAWTTALGGGNGTITVVSIDRSTQ